jgi:uncharacterized protein YbjT (DUF2867 family)
MIDTVLVLGATGKTGRRLVPQLTSRGLTVRAASRHPDDHGTFFDWDEPRTHGPALAGVDAVYLVTPAMVEDPSPVTGPFLELAAEAGVARVVALSAQDVGTGEGPEPGLYKMERQVMASSLDWTILRPTAFAQNFSEGFLQPGIVHGGKVVACTGTGTVPFVDAGDISAVAAAALVEDGHAKAMYTLTGPAALSFGRAAEIIGAATGREVVHDDITSDAMRQILEGAGLPADYAVMVLGTFEAIRAGHASQVSDDVDEVTGRPATSFEDYVNQAVSSWTP